MNTLAHEGPGPWIVLVPLFWAAAALAVTGLLRRAGLRRGKAGGRTPGQERTPHGTSSPIAVLGRRFASGEIDEEEYWRRLSVLDEQFGPGAVKDGAV